MLFSVWRTPSKNYPAGSYPAKNYPVLLCVSGVGLIVGSSYLLKQNSLEWFENFETLSAN